MALLLALLGAWAPARGAAGGELGGATALAQQAALTRPASAAVNYVPPLADRCGHPGAASGESCGALTALKRALPCSSWMQERRLLCQRELFVHWVKAGLTHGAQVGGSRAPSILGGTSLAPLRSILCTLCGTLRVGEGWAAGSRQLTFQLRYSAGSQTAWDPTLSSSVCLVTSQKALASKHLVRRQRCAVFSSKAGLSTVV